MKQRPGVLVALVAFVVRLAVVLWAAGSIPPAADGTYYHKLAVRLAEGHGYTWLWPDGVVTYAAHYPVGYPALIAAGYAVFGVKPVIAMLINALVGTGGAVAAWSLVRSQKWGLLAGLAVAVHPALVPYTAAIMTEGVTTALLVIAVALAERKKLVPMAIVIGLATLVRPQTIVFAPILGFFVGRGSLKARAWAAVLPAIVALLVCAPWTARNCVRMEKCALVSVNGGWNLAIGAQTDSGAWQEIAVPDACKTVFQEAAKDTCFGDEAKKAILAHPIRWVMRMPAKLRATFDYFGAAPWYLNAANAEAFPYRAKVVLGSIETFVSRLLLAAALVAVHRLDGGSLLRKVIVLLGLVACVIVPGFLAYLALAFAIVVTRAEKPFVATATAAVILATAATHAVFFGSGRYGLVVVPFVTALAFVRQNAHAAPVDAVQAIAGQQ